MAAMLPARIQKAPKREGRWRSQAHCTFVRSHACCNCGSTAAIEVAHVRLGSGAGMGQKPDDWRTVSLCGGLSGCHAEQHRIGEPAFWDRYAREKGQTVRQLIDAFCRASPKAAEIRTIRLERNDA